MDALGFEAVQASSGDRALQILAGDPGIDLLVTDHGMPNLSGKELMLLARGQHPHLQTLQTVRKLPFVVTRGEAGQDEDDKISVTPDRQFCG